MSRVGRVLSKRWPWATMAILVVLAYLFTVVEVRWSPTDDRPLGSDEAIAALQGRDDINVLFILIDTLRADHLGAWGYSRETSPFLDALAQTVSASIKRSLNPLGQNAPWLPSGQPCIRHEPA